MPNTMQQSDVNIYIKKVLLHIPPDISPKDLNEIIYAAKLAYFKLLRPNVAPPRRDQ